MRKSKLCFVALAAASVMATSTVLATSPALAATKKKVTINVWSWQNPMAADWAKVFKIYEDKNPGVKVKFTGYAGTDYPTVLATGLSDSSGPDIAMLHPYNSINQYVASGQLAPIDSKMVPELKSSFSEDSLAAARVNGKQYGVPFALQTVQVFYNKDIFAKVGVQVPKTRADIKPMLDKIKAAGFVPYAVTGKDSWQLVNVFDALVGTTYGGRSFVESARAGKASYTDGAFLGALKEFADQKDYFPDFVNGVSYTDSQTLFSSGKAAMYPGGAWELSGFQKSNPSLNIGVFSMPAPGPAAASNPTWGYEDGSFGLSAKAKNRAEAIKLLRWTTSKEFGAAFSNTLKQASSVKGVQPSDPVLREMIANYGANPVPMIWVTDFFGVSSPAPYAALMNGSQELLAGSSKPENVGSSIAESVKLFSKK